MFCHFYSVIVYLRARNYNPSTGRFISRDSFAGRRSDPLSLNLYTYCRNNPIRYIDPSGHSYGAINGEKFSINSAWDAKKFNELKSGKLSSSQAVTTTVSKSYESPITGGISKPSTSTTTYTTVLTVEETLQKKEDGFFTKVGKNIKSFFNNTFGAEYSVVGVTDFSQKYLPYNSPINVTHVSKDTEVITKKGDSSKPISVYCQTVSDCNFTDNSAGLKLNIWKVSANINFGLKNTGISFSYTNDNNTNYFGYSVSICDLGVSCNAGVTQSYSDTGSYTDGGEASINAMLAYALYSFANGVQYNYEHVVPAN